MRREKTIYICVIYFIYKLRMPKYRQYH